jgi:hypothetical protein
METGPIESSKLKHKQHAYRALMSMHFSEAAECFLEAVNAGMTRYLLGLTSRYFLGWQHHVSSMFWMRHVQGMHVGIHCIHSLPPNT